MSDLEPVALGTLVRTFARMSTKMLLQVADFPERCVTDPTLVWSGYANIFVQLFLFRLHLRYVDFITGIANDERFL